VEPPLYSPHQLRSRALEEKGSQRKGIDERRPEMSQRKEGLIKKVWSKIGS